MINSGYYLDEDKTRMYNENHHKRLDLWTKYKVVSFMPSNPDNYDVIFTIEHYPGYKTYTFHKSPALSLDELALIADGWFLLMYGHVWLDDKTVKVRVL